MDNRIRAPFFSEKKRANHHVRDYDLFNQKCLLRQGGETPIFFRQFNKNRYIAKSSSYKKLAFQPFPEH